MDYTAYCTVCGKFLEHNGEKVSWPNGLMVETAARLHTNETGHEVIVGTIVGPSHSAEIKPPATMKEGLLNFIQMIINELETGNTREALLKAVDLRQDIMSGIYTIKEDS